MANGPPKELVDQWLGKALAANAQDEFQVTPQLRFNAREGRYEQLWVCAITGRQEWRDVPVVEG